MITSIQGFVAVQQKATITSCVTVLTVVAFSGLMYWLQQKRNKAINIPKTWKPIGSVQQLFVYPLKSGKAIELKSADCTTLGLMEAPEMANEKFLFRDRFFLIYQAGSQKFMTARQKNSILLITLSSNGKDIVTLSSSKSDEAVTFKIPDQDNINNLQCSVHSNEVVDSQDCGDEVAAWLSKVILEKEAGLRLGFHSKNSKHRHLNEGPLKDYVNVYKTMTDNDLGAYSDIASYMVISQASLDDLNKKLEPVDKISARNFRPNIVVSGPEISAYDEDKWQWLKIGDDVVIRGFKPCSRCLMVTLDPDEGKANPNKEPLNTLKQYRQVTDPSEKELEGNSPIFGRYCGLYMQGTISVGDTLYIPS